MTSSTTSPSTASTQRPAVGVALFLLVLVLFSFYDAFAKYQLQWHPPEVMNLSRYIAITSMATAVLLYTSGGLRSACQHLRQHSRNTLLWLRSLCLALVALSFMTALVDMPLAEATAIYFTAPLIMVALSARLLGESVRAIHWVGVTLGFAGMLLMVRPGGDLPFWPSMLMVIAAVCYALFQLLTRRLAGQVPAPVQFFYMAMACFVVTVSPIFWNIPSQWPSASQWLVIIAGGCVSGVAQLLLLAAYRHVSAATLAPLNYLQLLFAVLISVFFFQRLPDALAMLGMSLIAAAGVFLAISRNRRPA